MKDKETRKDQLERIKKIEEENKVYESQLNQLKQQKHIRVKEDQVQMDMELIKNEKEQMKNEFYEEERK